MFSYIENHFWSHWVLIFVSLEPSLTQPSRRTCKRRELTVGNLHTVVEVYQSRCGLQWCIQFQCLFVCLFVCCLVYRCHEQVEANIRELVSKILETEKEVGPCSLWYSHIPSTSLPPFLHSTFFLPSSPLSLSFTGLGQHSATRGRRERCLLHHFGHHSLPDGGTECMLKLYIM